MNRLHILALLVLTCSTAFSQTCTVTGPSVQNWDGNGQGSGISCAEGGNAEGKTTLIIPAGFTVNFDDKNDTWTGTAIEVNGTLNIIADPTIHSNIIVNDGGLLNIQGKLNLAGSSCPYSLVIRAGGAVDVGGTGADRLTICGKEIMKGAAQGSCNDCGGTNSGQCPYNGHPYCEPDDGFFTGPSGYDDTGYNATLPVKLLYFLTEKKDNEVSLFWATSQEENFYKFIVQRSVDGWNFEDIGHVDGKGFNIYGTETEYTFVDNQPLLGYNYYRLKAVDLDDTFEYFGVKAVKVEGARKLSVFPNPVSGRTIEFQTNFNPQEFDRIVLINPLGVEVYNAPIGTTNRIELPGNSAPGVYTLRYRSENRELTARVVVRE